MAALIDHNRYNDLSSLAEADTALQVRIEPSSSDYHG